MAAAGDGQRYQRLQQIGSGTFGQAWLVQSRASGRQYVIKEIKVTALPENEREQSVNEVAILSRCKHVNIIRYKEAFIEHLSGTLNIVMEYADGGDLYARICQQRESEEYFSEQLVLNWFIQVTFAVQYLHSKNILHRDLKTQNIFLTSSNLVKVGDFGIARSLRFTQDLATTAIGTPYYLSPEICQRQPYNHKSDQWAVGCILYEMCCLTHPFNASDFESLVLRILQAHYSPIPSCFSQLVRDLVTVLLRCQPERRPSAEQVLMIPALKPHVDTYVQWQNTALSPSKAARNSLPASTSPTSSTSSGSNRLSLSQEELHTRPQLVSAESDRNPKHEDRSKLFFDGKSFEEHVRQRLSPDSLEGSRPVDDQANDGINPLLLGDKGAAFRPDRSRSRSKVQTTTAASKSNGTKAKNPSHVTQASSRREPSSAHIATNSADCESGSASSNLVPSDAVEFVKPHSVHKRGSSILKRNKKEPVTRSYSDIIQHTPGGAVPSRDRRSAPAAGLNHDDKRISLSDSTVRPRSQSVCSPQQDRPLQMMRSPSSFRAKKDNVSTRPGASSLIKQVFLARFSRHRQSSEESSPERHHQLNNSPLCSSPSKRRGMRSPAKFFARPNLSVATRTPPPSSVAAARASRKSTDSCTSTSVSQVPRRGRRSDPGSVKTVSPGLCGGRNLRAAGSSSSCVSAAAQKSPNQSSELPASDMTSVASANETVNNEHAELEPLIVPDDSCVPPSEPGLQQSSSPNTGASLSGSISPSSGELSGSAPPVWDAEHSETVNLQNNSTISCQMTVVSEHVLRSNGLGNLQSNTTNTADSCHPVDLSSGRAVESQQDLLDSRQKQAEESNRDQKESFAGGKAVGGTRTKHFDLNCNLINKNKHTESAAGGHGMDCCSLVCAQCRFTTDRVQARALWNARLLTTTDRSQQHTALIQHITQEIGAETVAAVLAELEQAWQSGCTDLPPAVWHQLSRDKWHLTPLFIQALQLNRATK